ncbi:MAG: acyl-CoA thioesterase [Cyclobacteriaceae bacterium]
MTPSKTPSVSATTMTEMIMPNDTNPLNNLMGGKLMHFMDIAGAIAAQKHGNKIVVTASVDNISFQQPIRLGSVVTIEAKLTRAFSSSMEVHIEVTSEYIPEGTKVKSHEAFFTYVAVDENTKKPTRVPELIPETEEEKGLFESALTRRTLRLVMAGRIAPEDASLDIASLVSSR